MPRPELTLYYRKGCHLCEDMERLLQELLDPSSFDLRRVDIDQDRHLQAQYNEWVPVLSLGEEELCHHFLDLAAVSEALAGYNCR